MSAVRLSAWMKGLEEFSVLEKSRMRKWGCIEPDTCEIHIKSSLPYEEKIKTLIHELLHYYYDEVLEKRWRGYSKSREEAFIESQTEYFYQKLTLHQRGILEFCLDAAEKR
jgi:hypothetical protein